MKKLVLLLASLLVGTGSILAENGKAKHAPNNAFNYGNSFIFMENGVTFSVYPDGEFDFYLDNQISVNAHAGFGPVGVTFNSGFDYNPYVQYDDYGAVIQVENVPIYYDYYGRVNRIGGIQVWYRHNMAYRIGGMHIYYTPRGLYNYHVGYINAYNPYYVYRPYHRYFVRPALGFCLVSYQPYRRYYTPVRYSYYQPYRYNTRRAYATVGKTYRYAPRTDRDQIYRNDARVSARSPQTRVDYGKSYRSDAARSAKSEVRSNRSQQSRSEMRREVQASQRRKATAASSESYRNSSVERQQQARKEVNRKAPQRDQSQAIASRSESRGGLEKNSAKQVRTPKQVNSSAQRSREQATGRSDQARKSAPSPQVRKAAPQSSRRSSGNERNRSGRSGNE